VNKDGTVREQKCTKGHGMVSWGDVPDRVLAPVSGVLSVSQGLVGVLATVCSRGGNSGLAPIYSMTCMWSTIDYCDTDC
jgi:hypothetical protein